MLAFDPAVVVTNPDHCSTVADLGVALDWKRARNGVVSCRKAACAMMSDPTLAKIGCHEPSAPLNRESMRAR